jgi:hypothetical protein
MEVVIAGGLAGVSDDLGAGCPRRSTHARWLIPRDVWTRFFSSAEREIAILANSALFLAAS